MEIQKESEPQCGLCSKVCTQAVRIAKCNHIFCSLCLLEYLAIRRYCPICVPKKKKAGFLRRYLLAYLHPVKLIKKIKKHKKRISRKSLIPITKPTNHLDQAGEGFCVFFWTVTAELANR